MGGTIDREGEYGGGFMGFVEEGERWGWSFGEEGGHGCHWRGEMLKLDFFLFLFFWLGFVNWVNLTFQFNGVLGKMEVWEIYREG